MKRKEKKKKEGKGKKRKEGGKERKKGKSLVLLLAGRLQANSRREEFPSYGVLLPRLSRPSRGMRVSLSSEPEVPKPPLWAPAGCPTAQSGGCGRRCAGRGGHLASPPQVPAGPNPPCALLRSPTRLPAPGKGRGHS